MSLNLKNDLNELDGVVIGGVENNNFNNSDDNNLKQNNFIDNNIPTSFEKIDLNIKGPRLEIKSTISIEESIKAFIGNKYENLANSTFNYSAFFFTFLYFFYRKMFLYGIVLFLFNFIILNLFDFPLLSLITNIISGLFFNKIYMIFVKRKVNKVRENNIHKNDNEILEICSKKGRTSLGYLFIGFLTNVIITITIFIIMITYSISTPVVDLIKDIYNNFVYYN